MIVVALRTLLQARNKAARADITRFVKARARPDNFIRDNLSQGRSLARERANSINCFMYSPPALNRVSASCRLARALCLRYTPIREKRAPRALCVCEYTRSIRGPREMFSRKRGNSEKSVGSRGWSAEALECNRITAPFSPRPARALSLHPPAPAPAGTPSPRARPGLCHQTGIYARAIWPL